MLSQEIQKIHDNEEIISIKIDEDNYPEGFKALDNPPSVIYAKGNLSLLNNQNYIAITGSEKATMKAMDVAIGLANMLISKNEVVVGGLASGCETGGHLGSVGAGGKSIAILSQPISEILNGSSRGLAEKIISMGGLLISEYAHRSDNDNVMDYDQQSFARNKLIAAISDGIILVESGPDGKEMEIANFARDMGKKVGAYRHPGGFDMTEPSKGNEMLILNNKAMAIRNIKDVDKFISDVNEWRKK